MKLHLVPARAGLLWVQRGLRTFRQQPLALLSLFFMFMALIVLLALISPSPWIASALVLALLPAATLVFMVAAEVCSRGSFPSLRILLTALRADAQEWRTLALLGALYAAGFLAIVGLTTWVDGGVFARVYLGGAQLSQQQMEQSHFVSSLVLAMGLNLLLSLLFWHAPALVHWHRVPPIKALFFSLVACLRNLAAYTVFGVLWTGIFIGVVLPTMVVAGAIGGRDAAAAVVMPTASLLMAMFFTSLYFTFVDSFIATPTEAPAAPT